MGPCWTSDSSFNSGEHWGIKWDCMQNAWTVVISEDHCFLFVSLLGINILSEADSVDSLLDLGSKQITIVLNHYVVEFMS